MQSSSGTTKRPRYFYGWNIVAVCFLAGLNTVEHNTSILGLYFTPLRKEFGWTRTAIAAVQTVSRVFEGIFAFLVGPLLDKYGARLLMVAGGIVVGVVFLALTRATTLWHFYLLRGALIGFGFTLMGGLVTSTVISNWFVRKRGRAISMAALGSSAGYLVMAPFTVWMLNSRWGWRGSFVAFALFIWVTVLLPAGILMRRRPEDMGLKPDGDESNGQADPSGTSAVRTNPSATSIQTERTWTRREVIKTATFWSLVTAFGISSFALVGINISTAPYLEDLGYSAVTIATVLSVRSVIRLVATPIWGFVAEHQEHGLVRAFPFLLQTVACISFVNASNIVWLWLGVFCFNVGVTGTGIVSNVIWANYFGRLSLGRVRSTAAPFDLVFSAFGPVFMNGVRDIFGTYVPVYALFVALFIMSSILLIVLRPPKD